MTDAEIDRTIAEIKEMARRIGCEFHPDPDKLLTFRRAQRDEESIREKYRRAVAGKNGWQYGSQGYWDN